MNAGALHVAVPPLPPLADELLDGYDDAQASLGVALEGVTPQAHRLFVVLQRRIFAESLAYVQPVLASPSEQLLFPAPRAFLSRTQELRVMAASSVFRFLDSRFAMLQGGMIERLLEPASAQVLHALMEGVAPSGVETNAGMVRATPTSWKPEANSFMHPPAPMAAELLDAAIDMARNAPAPAIARAGWLTFTILSIHPFVDGNGRTSRALFHLVAMEDADRTFEWGIAEQWAVGRRAYIRALQAGQQMEAYDPELMDPLPFMELCAVASGVGARLCAERVKTLDQRIEAVVARHGLDAEAAMLSIGVALGRNVTLSELAALLVGDHEPEPPHLVPMVEALVQRGLIDWSPRPASRRTWSVPDTRGLVPAPELLASVR